MPGPSCPICRAAVKARADNPAWPFCSARCRMVDLGRWLGEDYRVPGPPAAAGQEDEGEERAKGSRRREPDADT